MGIRAYNRASRYLAEQLARDYAAQHPIIRGEEPLCWQDERARLTGSLLNAQARVVALEEREASLRAELDRACGAASTAEEQASQARRAERGARRREGWAWGLIRTHLRPRTVQAYRDDCPEPDVAEAVERLRAGEVVHLRLATYPAGVLTVGPWTPATGPRGLFAVYGYGSAEDLSRDGLTIEEAAAVVTAHRS